MPPAIDRQVQFTYDGDGHRTQIQEYTSGTLTTTRDFIYQGDSIVQEKTNGTLSREYIDDEQGTIIKFCDPNCTQPDDDLPRDVERPRRRPRRVEDRSLDGALTLANSYTYSSWGAPTTTVAGGFSDLGLRFLTSVAGRPVGQLLRPRALLHARPPLFTCYWSICSARPDRV